VPTTVVICSGGLDSVTLAHKLAAEGRRLHLLSFDYGQRHGKELDFARACAARLGTPHEAVDIADLGRLLGGSALTGAQAVPEGHYAQATMKATVVPNRNAIMLAIAFGLAAGEAAAAGGRGAVAAAVHGGDHFIYPDCRPGFVAAFAAMQSHALEDLAEIALLTPFLETSKAGIVAEGARLGVPFAETWSCYKGGALHCGRCGTCVERREAFDLAGVADPTGYADPDYWIAACRDKPRAAEGGKN
jgi:7-cyano-7-deazaguanine synthase